MPLSPDKSINYTAGVVFDSGQFSHTADYFRIDVSDRIGITSNFTLTAEEIMTPTARILVTCGDSTAAQALTNRLDRLGHAVCGAATSGPQGVEQAADLRPDLVLIDLDQDAGFVEAAGSIRRQLGIPVVYLVGEVDEFPLERARKTDPFGYVVKPLDDRQLRLSIDAALSQRAAVRRERENHDKDRGTILELQRRIDVMNAVVESMAEGVVVADHDGRLLFVNRAVKEMLGADGTIDNVDRMTEECRLMASCGPDDWPAAYGLFLPDRTTPFPPDQLPLSRALRGESSDGIEMFLRNAYKPDGSFLSVRGRPLRDADQMVGGVVVFHDITQLKDAEGRLQRANEELRQQNQFMELVFESISDGLVVADSKGRLTMANASAKRVVGMGLTDAPSDDWSHLYGTFYPDRTTPFPSEQLPLVRAMNGESSDDVGLFIRNPHVPDGVHISVSGRPLQSPAGEHAGGVIVFRDVTQWLRAQEALLRAFDRGRLEVIETVLHNIGNAISSVATAVDTIRNRSGNNELLSRFVALADSVAAHEEDWIDWLSSDRKGRNVRSFLLALVQDLVTWNASLNRTAERASSRVRHIVDIIRTQESFTNGTVERKAVRLNAAITDAVTVLDGSLAARGIKVDVDCTNAPDEILIQDNNFNQMLVNLLKNAMEAIDDLVKLEPDVEHADRCIRVFACVRQERLEIDVIDNGIGMVPEHTRDLFTAGYTTKTEGTGLGLHSAASFVRGSGGRIEALSEGVGRGATLRVTLPLIPFR